MGTKKQWTKFARYELLDADFNSLASIQYKELEDPGITEAVKSLVLQSPYHDDPQSNVLAELDKTDFIMVTRKEIEVFGENSVVADGELAGVLGRLGLYDWAYEGGG